MRARLAAWVAMALMVAATWPARAQELPAPTPAPEPAGDAAPVTMVVGSGEVGGYYYPIAGAVCRMVNRERTRHGLRCMVEPSQGSAANIAALRLGDLGAAMVQSRAAHEAFKGTGSYKKETPFAELRSLMALHGETIVVLTRKNSRIRSLAELKGKRVHIGRPDTFQRAMADLALGAGGLQRADLGAALELEPNQLNKMLCDGQVDAAVLTVVHPAREVQRAAASCGAALLDLGGPAVEQAAERQPWLYAARIPKGTYDGMKEEITTLGLVALLVTTDKLPEPAAYEAVKAIVEGLEPFTGMHPALSLVRKEQLPKAAAAVPLHDGALRFFREAGLAP